MFRATLALSAALAAASVAPVVARAQCTEVREGVFFPMNVAGGQFLVTCWPIRFTPATAFRYTDGTPANVATLTSQDHVRATGCLAPDGLWLDAELVEVLSPPPSGSARSVDATVVFVNIGATAWQVQSTTDVTIAPTGTNNPDLMLVAGNRYTFSSTAFGAHPFALIAKGASAAGDTTVLSSGATAGTLEADPTVNWTDTGTDITFTISPSLVAALEGTASQDPGYKCVAHPSTMRGAIMIHAPSSVENWNLY